MSENNGKFVRRIETDICIGILDEMGVGDVITWEDLDQQVGLYVRDHRHIYDTAFRNMESKNKGFCVERGVGIRRMPQAAVIDHSEAAIRRQRRAATKATKRLVRCVPDLDALSEEDKRRYDTTRSVLELSRHVAMRSTIEKVASRVLDTSRALPVQKTIEAIMGRQNKN